AGGAGGAVTVRGPAGSHAARRAVLALPPSLAIRIAPDLPAPLHRLGAAIQRGAVVKCFAAYDRAFWRDAGLSGEAYRPRRAPRDYLEADWAADPWSAGCVASTPPGALAAGAVWRGAHGRLHLAGTEAAVRWPGYMEGAIEAGERAAADALAALAPDGKP